MKPLAKVLAFFFIIFMTIFFIMNSLHLLSFDDIKMFFETHSEYNQSTLFFLVIFLLIIDFFISVPTLPLSLLAGYILGFKLAFLSVICGLFGAGILGYYLGTKFGDKVISFILKDENEAKLLKETYEKYGISIILISRAVPMLPEMSAALAGINNLKFRKFLIVWGAHSIPYAAFLTYTGSISTVQSPGPSVIFIIVFYSLLWSVGYFFIKRGRNENPKSQ